MGYQFDMGQQCIIPMNSTYTHEAVVRPALEVLSRPGFASANKEFMEAVEHYKRRVRRLPHEVLLLLRERDEDYLHIIIHQCTTNSTISICKRVDIFEFTM